MLVYSSYEFEEGGVLMYTYRKAALVFAVRIYIDRKQPKLCFQKEYIRKFYLFSEMMFLLFVVFW